MRIRITAKAGYSNPRRGIELSLGAVAEVPDDVAVKLLNAGLAVAAPAHKVETAAAAAPEMSAEPAKKSAQYKGATK